MDSATIDIVIVEEVIDRLQGSKEDLLSFALVARAWVPRSRYHLLGNFWLNAKFQSFEELLGFVQLLASPFCTLVTIGKVLADFVINSQPSLAGPLRPDASMLLLDNRAFRTFLDNTDVHGSLAVNMDNMLLQDSQCSPFPWDNIAQWTSLCNLTISATLPSLTTLVTIIISLANLDTAELNVAYIDPSVPNFKTGPLHRSFRSLEIGPRGHQLFSWLALAPRGGVHFFTLIVTIGTEDLTPLKEFAASEAHYDIDWFEVTFQSDRVSEFASCLPSLESVSEMTVAFHFSPRTETSYKHSVRSVITALNPFSLSCLTFKIPSRLGIPWPLSRSIPHRDMGAYQLGELHMRNHIELASLDQEETIPLHDFAGACLEERRTEFSGDEDQDHRVFIWVAADRGAVCYA